MSLTITTNGSAQAPAGTAVAGGRRVHFRHGVGGEGGVDFEDLFGQMFGGGGGYGPIPGADQEAELELTLEEAYRGGKRTLRLDGRQYDVDIPAGVLDGQRIRLAGQGGRSNGDAPPGGDLYLVVRIKPHSRFRVQGRDIYVDLPVSPWEAVLGSTVVVPTPGGEAKVKVVPGSSTGRKLRLRGEGMPNPRGRQRQPLRRNQGHGAAETDSTRARAVPAVGHRIELRSEERDMSTPDPRSPSTYWFAVPHCRQMPSPNVPGCTLTWHESLWLSACSTPTAPPTARCRSNRPKWPTPPASNGCGPVWA